MPTGSPRLPSDDQNRLALSFYVDTNFIYNPGATEAELRALHRAGWIALVRTDTVDTELGGEPDPDRRAQFLDASSEYVESYGPLIVDHSRLDHCVVGNDEDGARVDDAFRVLFPETDRHGKTRRSQKKLRDAMHVATAIRYGGDGLITNDLRDLFRKSDEIASAFDGFRIYTAETALSFVMRMQARWEARNIQT